MDVNLKFLTIYQTLKILFEKIGRKIIIEFLKKLYL